MLEKFAAIGPYLMLELIMPGGTIMAILLYLARRRLASVAAQTLS